MGSKEAALTVAAYKEVDVVEPLLSGIVLGLIPVTILGLLADAYLQYRRGNKLIEK